MSRAALPYLHLHVYMYIRKLLFYYFKNSFYCFFIFFFYPPPSPQKMMFPDNDTPGVLSMLNSQSLVDKFVEESEKSTIPKEDILRHIVYVEGAGEDEDDEGEGQAMEVDKKDAEVMQNWPSAMPKVWDTWLLLFVSSLFFCPFPYLPFPPLSLLIFLSFPFIPSLFFPPPSPPLSFCGNGFLPFKRIRPKLLVSSLQALAVMLTSLQSLPKRER